MKRLITAGLIATLLASSVFASDFAGNIEKLMGDNATNYVMPMVEGFSSSLNTGLYKKASVSAGKLIPVGFDIGVVSMFTTVPEDKMDFAHNLQDFVFDFNLTSEGDELEDIQLTFEDIFNASSNVTANIASSDKGAKCTLKSEDEIYNNVSQRLLDAGVSQSVIDTKENSIRSFINESLSQQYDSFSFPQGLGLANVAAFALQANVRLPLIGLEVTGRYLPTLQINKDIGDFNMYGVGVRKSLPVPIIDVTAGAFLQKLQIGDIFELNTKMVHLEVGKSIGIPFLFSLSPYAGIGYAMTDASLNYTIAGGSVPGLDQDKDLSYDIELDNSMILTAGVTAQIIPLTYINLEVDKSEYMTACLKLGFILK